MFNKLLIVFLFTVYTVNCFCPASSLLYRTHDGKCNNVLKKDLGKTHEFFKIGPEGTEPYPWAHERALSPPPTYADLHLLPSPGPRGNARNISNYLFQRHDPNDLDVNNHSVFSSMFGQFINHDFENNQFQNFSIRSFNPLVVYYEDRNDYSCLETTERPLPHGYRCNDENNILYSGVKFSGGKFFPDGTFKVYNNATSYLDLDHVYGRTDEINSKLRAHTGGKLLSTESIEINIVIGTTTNYTTTAYNLLPTYSLTQTPVAVVFPEIGNHDHFFVAGDERVNENLALTFFHTLWMREHNKVCDEIIASNVLYRLFPQLFDDVIYQKARMITIAKYQHILYTQYFPSVYGQFFANRLGNYNGYNPLADPTTSLVFASAAFRYGHYTPKPYMALDECGVAIDHNEPTEDQEHRQIYLGFQNPSPTYLTPLGRIVECGGLDNIARGLINEKAQKNGLSIENILRNFTSGTGATDLGTFDLIRARHNHVPNYQKVRMHYYGLDSKTNRIYGSAGCPAYLENSPSDDPLSCFLYITSDHETAQKIKDLYGKVNNVDAIVGMQAEDHVEGTSFGRTTGNIIADQFRRARDGDRFFYRTVINSGMVTNKEKNEILSTTMGEILRRNLGADFPDNPFIVPENYRQSLIDSCAN